MIARTLCCCFLLAVVLTLSSVIHHTRAQQQNPGFSTSVQESALNYVIGQVLPLVQSQIEKQTIPDINQDVHTPVGRVAFSVSQAHITRFALGQISAHIVQDTGFQIIVNDAQASLNAHWHFREHSFPHISDSGSVDVSVGLSVSLQVRVSHDEQGHLTTDIINVQLNMNRFDIKLHGGASWLYNLFINSFKGSIRDSILKMLNGQITGNLNDQIKKQVATIQYIHRVGGADANVQLDYSILQTVFNANYPVYFQAGAKGLFSQIGGVAYTGPNPPEIPFQPLTQAPCMMQLLITDYLVNTFAWSWYQSGRLFVTVTDKDIPSQIPLRLTTTSLMLIAPDMYAKYPNMPMQLTLKAYGTDQSKSPRANITSALGAGAFAEGDAIFSVIDGQNIVEVFTIDMLVILEMKVGIADGTTITGSLQLDTLKLSLESSQVGNVNVAALNTFLQSTLQYVAIPLVNVVLAKGFPIPTVSGLALQNSQIIFKDRYIGVASNFTFTPEPRIWGA